MPWRRHPEAESERSGRRIWLRLLLILVVLPILVGGAVLLIAGRPLAFEVLQWRIAKRFPEVAWIKPEQLAGWRRDPSKTQPLVLDARTEIEYKVSSLARAVRIDPYRPSLRPLQAITKQSPVVVYSSAGYRGARVASWLQRLGYANVANLSGGIFAWVNDGRPIFRGETPTARVHPYDQKWGQLVKPEFRAEAPDLEGQSAGP
jgi:rhodanese-related sulfurtransferase